MRGANIDRCRYWQASRITKNIVTIEFRASNLCRVSHFIKTEALATFVQNCGLKDARCQYWQVSNLTGVENQKKLLPLLNPPPSLCVEYEIASKLKHLPFVQNYGLTDGRCQIERCQYWQVSKITKNYCHHWIHRPWFVQCTKFHQNWSIYRSSSKTMAWKMTDANIVRCQESQKTIVINEFSTFKLYTMQNFVEEG